MATGDAVDSDNARTIREIKQVVAAYRSMTVTGITPSGAPSTGSVNITNLVGIGFVSGAAVKLTKSGQSNIVVTDVIVVSSAKITCVFALNGKMTGTWNVVVTNPDFQSSTLVNGFSINVPVSSVTLNKNNLSLNKGTTETLIATVSPTDAANKAVKWSSSNTGVAMVDGTGLVTAYGNGTCTITVTTVEGGFTATCLVNVLTVTIPVTSVSLNKTTLSLNKNASETLVATVLPTNATNKTIAWSSNNTAVANVNSSGLVTAVGGGVCGITATTIEGACVAWCVVIVPSAPVTGISFNKTTATLNIGNSETLTATVSPSNAINKNIIWASFNTSVATVNSSGLETAVGGGICAITATTVDGTYFAWCVVTVLLVK